MSHAGPASVGSAACCSGAIYASVPRTRPGMVETRVFRIEPQRHAEIDDHRLQSIMADHHDVDRLEIAMHDSTRTWANAMAHANVSTSAATAAGRATYMGSRLASVGPSRYGMVG